MLYWAVGCCPAGPKGVEKNGGGGGGKEDKKNVILNIMSSSSIRFSS